MKLNQKRLISGLEYMLHCSSISTMAFSKVSLEMVLTDSWMWVIFGKDSFFLISLQDQPLQHHQNAGLVLRQHQYFRDAGGMLGGWTVGANQDGWLSSSTSPLLFGATHQCRYLFARCQNLGKMGLSENCDPKNRTGLFLHVYISMFLIIFRTYFYFQSPKRRSDAPLGMSGSLPLTHHQEGRCIPIGWKDTYYRNVSF